MILGFSKKINNKPTYFVEKILRSLEKHKLIEFDLYEKFIENLEQNQMINFDYLCHNFGDIDLGKIHTIREDKTNRWNVGMVIDFFINVRTKDMFRFAPQVPVVSIQKIEIAWHSDCRNLELSKLAPKRLNYVDVIIDDTILQFEEIKTLAQNDGFDTIELFFAYFNEDFKGKIIHWTDKRY